MEKLINVLDPLTTDGIFHKFRTLNTNIEWLDDTIVDYLDNEYYLGHSGQKYTSRMYDYLRKAEDDGTITSALEQMALILLTKNLSSWNKQYEALTKNYDPLANYDMTERETVASKVKTEIDTDSNTYGFNSDSAVPTGKVGSSSTTSGSADDNIRNLTRSGNIGVTTSAQMLEGELEVRKHKFYQIVMNDIDKDMCLCSY